MTNKEKIDLYFSLLEQRLAKIPDIVGNEVVNYSLEAFRKQGWDGVPWQKDKDKKKNKPGNNQAILVSTGKLRISIGVINTTPTSVTVGSRDYVPYAKIHNYGGVINKPAREEDFQRSRYKIGKRGKMFGGMGAFKKMTLKDKVAASGIKGLKFKAYQITMPQRQYLGITNELRERIRVRVMNEIKEKTTTE